MNIKNEIEQILSKMITERDDPSKFTVHMDLFDRYSQLILDEVLTGVKVQIKWTGNSEVWTSSQGKAIDRCVEVVERLSKNSEVLG